MYIYKITNTINNKIYIGQTTRDVDVRFKEHCRHKTTAIDKAINKYGADAFVVELLDEANSIDELNELEKHYIELYNSTDKHIGYNQCAGGDNTTGYHHRESSKIKMSESKKGKYTNADNPFYGKTHSDEQKAKWSNDRKGRKLSDEWKKKIAEANHKKVINLDTGEVFNSVRDASLSCGAFDTQITRVCKGKRNRCRGYRWAYHTI